MYPVLFEIGPLTINSFGAMMALGFIVAGWLAGREMGRRGMDPELSSSLVLWAAAGGIIGSKLWALIEDWRGVLADPIGMIFSGGGFVWYGGLLGGVLAVTIAIRRHRLPWLPVADCIAPGLAIGQALGRVGCQLAGDGDWGTPSDLPWAMSYPNAIYGLWDRWLAENGLPPDTRVHPTPVYEALAYLAVFAFLWRIRRRPMADGMLLWTYFLLAPAARFLVEFVRHNPARFAGLTDAQLFSLTLIAIGVWGLWAQPSFGEHSAPLRETGKARATR